MTSGTQQVYFSTSLRLGPADIFLPALCVCRGLFGNRLLASVLEVRNKSGKTEVEKSTHPELDPNLRDLGHRSDVFDSYLCRVQSTNDF